MRDKTFSDIVLRVCITVIILIFTYSLIFSQEKQDSTKFKSLVGELQLLQNQIASIDSVKLKLLGAYEYTLQKALEEQKKLNEKK